jgi:Ca2+-dependent lipid-binding protein
LPIADLSGKSDPYIVFACGRWDKKHKLKQGEKHSVKSSVKRQTLNPDWDETLMLNVPSLSEGLTAWCWDWDSPPKPHDSMGYCFVDLLDLQDGVPMEFAPPLSKKGFLRFVLTFTML